MITGNQQDSLFIKTNKNPYGWSGLPDSEHAETLFSMTSQGSMTETNCCLLSFHSFLVKPLPSQLVDRKSNHKPHMRHKLSAVSCH